MRIAHLEDALPQATLITHWLEESALVHALDSGADDCVINRSQLLTRQALPKPVWHSSPEVA